jgi:hypothetical protein
MGEVMETQEQPRLHSGHIEVAVAMLLNYRVYVIVPNISHGLYLNHECDVLALKDSRFTEIEIKISASDLKRDFEKKHGHRSQYISRLVYAVPENLIDLALMLCPKASGIIAVKWNSYIGKYTAYWVRTGKHDKAIPRVPDSIQKKFMELGCMRIWSLKTHNYKK